MENVTCTSCCLGCECKSEWGSVLHRGSIDLIKSKQEFTAVAVSIPEDGIVRQRWDCHRQSYWRIWPALLHPNLGLFKAFQPDQQFLKQNCKQINFFFANMRWYDKNIFFSLPCKNSNRFRFSWVLWCSWIPSSCSEQWSVTLRNRWNETLIQVSTWT